MISDHEKILNLLSNYLSKEDNQSSSHWNHYHQISKFDDKNILKIEGLEGYSAKSSNPIKNFLHFLLQTKYKKMGENFKDFSNYYDQSKTFIQLINGNYDLCMLRQVLTLSFINQMFSFKEDETFLIIGDGYANLGGLIRRIFPKSTIYLINLNKNLYIDYLFFKKAFPNEKLFLIENENNFESEIIKGKVAFLRAENFQLIPKFNPTWAFNIVSMQEMSMDIIRKYFEVFRKCENLKFYCCNRESKTHPDGEVIEFTNYPWAKSDKIFLDELTPWHQTYYDFKYPFYHPYDGKIKHRIVQF